MNTFNRVKRNLLKLLGLIPLVSLPRLSAGQAEPVIRIAFGSCLHQDKPQEVWDAVLENDPDLFIFLGDNIYGDSDDPDVLAMQYRKLAGKDGFRRLRANTEIMAIWDDHDYGRNDTGLEYPAKEASRRLMLDFWREPVDSNRWLRPDGIYTAKTFSKAGKRIQIILPDLRWNRSRLNTVSSPEALDARETANMGPYVRTDDPAAMLLGEAQWRWLEAQFQETADLRIIGSSIQLLADFTGWESWANFPAERKRFLDLLSNHQKVPTLIISGDVHWCELSRYQPDSMSRPVIELTSSGLTETWEKISPNRHRIGEAFARINFGLIEIDGSRSPAPVHLSVRDVDNRNLISHSLSETFTL